MPAEPPRAEIVSTSIYRFLLSRMEAAHRSASMGAFSGPPAIGKTTAARTFISEHWGEAALVTVRFPNAKPVLVLQEVLAAIRRASDEPAYSHAPSDKRGLQSALAHALDRWQRCVDGRPLTVIFDEDQNLSPEAIEAMRFWNDAAERDLQPLGLVFLGNHQFRLESGADGPSFLSAAVRSRTPYRKTFSYHDLTDDDLTLVIEARGVVDPTTVGLLLSRCRANPINRDLRELGRELEGLREDRPGEPVTAETFHRFYDAA
jgi:DNA transposition AAA+ family ATPase